MPPENSSADETTTSLPPDTSQPSAETVLESQTAQIPASEPLAPAPEPIPVSPPSVIAPVVNFARDLAAKARAVIQNRKRVKLDKILTEIMKKGSVTNDHVEKLLHVSDATATRYLSQLEKEGKIQQIGKTGKSVKYQKL